MTNTPEPYKKAVAYFGSEAALARALRITPWAASKWDKHKIPQDRCLQIEEATARTVLADELRPDINWAYVRASLRTVA